MRGYQEEGVVDAIREAGGEMFVVTSEPHSLALNAQENWESLFDHIGDPHHEILAECKERDWLSLYIWQGSGGLKGADNEWVSHPKGCFQPGVLAVSREGRVLYRWRSRPGRENLNGAVARPTAAHVWGQVKSELDKSPDAPDVPLDDDAELDSKSPPQLLFLAMLLANGWFWKPRFFIHRTGDESMGDMMRMMKTARIRLLFFAAGWIFAFALLPLWIPGLALLSWFALIVPRVNAVRRMSPSTAPDERQS